MTTEAQIREALDLLTSPSQVQPQASPTPEEREIARLRKIGFKKGVVGLGLGSKVTAGSAVSTLALKYYVVTKHPESSLSPRQLVPKEFTLPTGIRVITDVEAVGRPKPQSLMSRVRPALPGYSIGNPKVTSGTFGCVVKTTALPIRNLILSNNHVLANTNLAHTGDAIFQPGVADGGTKADTIAKLFGFQRLTADGEFSNLCDAAVALPTDETEIGDSVPSIGVPTGVNLNLRRGMKIQKTGATTGHTLGTIQDIDLRIFIPYLDKARNTIQIGFQRQVKCSRYADGGDSGSAVFDMQKRLVGLHFAGSSSMSIFSPIQFVFSALKISL